MCFRVCTFVDQHESLCFVTFSANLVRTHGILELGLAAFCPVEQEHGQLWRNILAGELDITGGLVDSQGPDFWQFEAAVYNIAVVPDVWALSLSSLPVAYLYCVCVCVCVSLTLLPHSQTQ